MTVLRPWHLAPTPLAAALDQVEAAFALFSAARRIQQRGKLDGTKMRRSELPLKLSDRQLPIFE